MVVEPEQARWFRQECEKFKMEEEDRMPTAEEHLKWVEKDKKWREESRQEEQERESKIIRNPLSKAVWDSNLDLVQNLLKQNDIDINQSDSDGRTPLGAAISKATVDNFDFVRLLVEAGADINKQSFILYSSRVTPFCGACSYASGNLDLLRYLVEHGADTKGALSAASVKGDMSLVQYLLELGGFDIHNDGNTDGSSSPLRNAIHSGNLELIRFFIEQGAMLNNALHTACGSPSYYSCRALANLFERGSNQHLQADDRGQTPLFNASNAGRTDIVQYLLEAAKGEIDIDRGNVEGRTALHAAVGSFKEATVQCLVTHGAKVDRVDNDGVTAFWLAASSGYVVIAEYLLDHGAELNKAANDGNTPLHIAATNANEWTPGLKQVVSMLLSFGASLKATNNEGRLPIDVAANDQIRQLMDDEFLRRRDHGYKRSVIPQPTTEEEQDCKRPRLEGEGESSSSSSSGQACASSSSTQEEKEKMEEEEDSEPSDEEDN